MSCDLCREFPIRTMREIDEEIAEGSLSVEEIASKHFISSALLEEHIKRCGAAFPTTGHELLNTLLRDIREAADDRKKDYDDDPEANQHAMSHYVNLVREAREIIMAMDRIRPSDELAQEIVRKVVNPIIRLCVVASVEEGNRLRDELIASLGQENFESIDEAVKRNLRRFASRLKGEAEEVIEKLPEILASGGNKKSKNKSLPPSLESSYDSSEPIH